MSLKLVPLLGVVTLGLAGCLPEDEPNNGAEQAFQQGPRSFQLWSGDPTYPAEGTLPVPSGKGTLPIGDGDGLGAGDIDSWPISLFDYETGEWADVSHFNGTLWVSPGDTVVVWWTKWISGDNDEAIWELRSAEVFTAPNDRIAAFDFQVDVDGGSLWALELFGCGADYGFILSPVLN